MPNTELGHIQLDGLDAEDRAAASIRKRDDLSWEQWAVRVNRYLVEIVKLFSPELIILGGGASKRPENWVQFLDVDTEVVVASMANNAGIVGATLMRAGRHESVTDAAEAVVGSRIRTLRARRRLVGPRRGRVRRRPECRRRDH